MKLTGRVIPLILTVMAGVLVATAPAIADERRITVTGEGQVAVAPDMARIVIGVSEEAPTAAEALGRMSRSGESILAELATAGIAERDIQTSGLTLRPVHDYRGDGEAARITGFAAETRFVVRVRDLSGLGGILDRVVRSGGANRLEQVAFGLSDEGAARDAARRDAVAEAQAKAALFAEAAGVGLGPLISLNETVSGGGPVPMVEMRMMDAASGSVPLAGGEVTLEAQLTMVFGIAE